MRELSIHSQNDHPRIRYTLNFLQQHPLVKQANIAISYQRHTAQSTWQLSYGPSDGFQHSDFTIPAQELFFSSTPIKYYLHANTYTFQNEQIYSVESLKKTRPESLIHEGHFQFDLLETIFFHISRYEEFFQLQEDGGQVDRPAEEHHLLIREQLYRQPVVDRLVGVFLEVISGSVSRPPTTYDLTHDVDFLYRYPSAGAWLRALAGTLYRGEGASMLRRHLGRYARIRAGREKDPFDCFHWLFSTKNHWKRKTVYLMAGGATAYDNHYQLQSTQVREVIRLARESGYEIGLHPSYNAGFKEELFTSEKKKLEQLIGRPVYRSRQHWLRWDWQQTPYILSRGAIREDSSMGFRHHVGFRAGTGFPYYMYDFRSEKAFPWREHPLAIMDSAAIHEARNTGSDPVQLLDDFLQQHRLGTHLMINFHNSNFDPAVPFGEPLANFYRLRILSLGE